MKQHRPYRFLFAGGGTGGHLFPALAVAEEIRRRMPDAEILFVGTKHKIEAEIVPKLGYAFKTIWISGFARTFSFSAFLFPLKVFVSFFQSIWIAIRFKPDVAIGTGGYVSGPAVRGASLAGAKVMLLEQNSYPGITTRLLEKYADEIHIGLEDAQKYLRQKEKIFVTGNPIRSTIVIPEKGEAQKMLGLNPAKKTLLVMGGSLGARSMNDAAAKAIAELIKNDVQIIWQTGKRSFEMYKTFQTPEDAPVRTLVFPFIENMAAVYGACDLLAARAGATTIAEISAFGIPSLLIPSPNVAENHQFYNARSLEEKGAAYVLEDGMLQDDFLPTVLNLIADDTKLLEMRTKVKQFAKPDAARIIAERAIILSKQSSVR